MGVDHLRGSSRFKPTSARYEVLFRRCSRGPGIPGIVLLVIMVIWVLNSVLAVLLQVSQ